MNEEENQLMALVKEIEAVKKEADKLMMDKIAHYEKRLKQKDDRIRELEQINKEHQDANGKLREEIKSIELGTVNNFRRKGVL